MRKKQQNKMFKRQIVALRIQEADLDLQLISVKNEYDETVKKSTEALNDYVTNFNRLQKIEESIQKCNEGILK